MKVLITGSAGHLGEALAYTLKIAKHEVVGVDLQDSLFTTDVGTITDRSFLKARLQGVKQVFHTATLHKPHIATHDAQQFIDSNITGTLNLLQESVAAGVESFIFTSTTSVFGDTLTPPAGEPAAWVTEESRPIPKNIYGVTKAAAEDLCQLYHRNHGLSCLVLRTSRFFPEEDDNPEMRYAYEDGNLKANEYLFRRVDLEDVVNAHLAAARHAQDIGFSKYIISATTPFGAGDLQDLRTSAAQVVKRLFPDYETLYQRHQWKMLPGIDRVYVNEKARNELGWQPKYDFHHLLDLLKTGSHDLRSNLAKMVGSKGYHNEHFSEGPYPVQPVDGI
jgi:nucleoside-diphosphate-sugar epimerase